MSKKPTLEEIGQASETTSVGKMLKWVNEKIGNTRDVRVFLTENCT